MNFPAVINEGDTVKWRDVAAADSLGNPITSSIWTLKYYFRFDRNQHGATATGTAYGTGWEFSLSATTTDGFTAGDTGYWQAVATRTSPSETVTLGTGQFQVLANLAYTGNPGAIDNRSQVQKDLDAVQAAIRAIISGGVVKQYTIGNRSLSKYDLTDLLSLETKLKADLKREQMAQLIANGLGNPFNLFVRF